MSSQPPRVDRLRHIGLCAPRVSSASTFYEAAWGLRSVAGMASNNTMFRGTGQEHHILELVDHPTCKIDHIQFGAADRDTVDQLYARISAGNIPTLGAPGELGRSEGGYGFELLDPERRLLRISSDVARHPDDQDIDGHPSKISHIVLNSPDIERMQQFYCDALGFSVSDRLEDQMVFIRCGDQGHHQIAFFRNIHASLNHVSFELSTRQSVEAGIQRLAEKGSPILWGTGCHGMGKSCSPTLPIRMDSSSNTRITQRDSMRRITSPTHGQERRKSWIPGVRQARRLPLFARRWPGFQTRDMRKQEYESHVEAQGHARGRIRSSAGGRHRRLEAGLNHSTIGIDTPQVNARMPASLEKHGNPNVVTMDKGTSCLAQGSVAQTVLVEIEKCIDPPPVTAFDLPQFEQEKG